MTLHLLGDIAFSRESSATWVSPEVRCLLRSGLTMANLECVLTDTPSAETGLVVSAPTAASTALRDAGIQLVSLANNHAMDCGVAGLTATIRSLERVGIRVVGAGLGSAEAFAPVEVRHAGKRIGVIARLDPSSLQVPRGLADGQRGGVAPFDLDEVLRTGRDMRRTGCDLTVCLVHWGVQGVPFLPHWLLPSLRRLLTVFDVVGGSHAHILQPAVYGERSVGLCGMGNFYFAPFEADGRRYYDGIGVSRIAGISELSLSDGARIRLRFHPTWQEPRHNVVRLLREPLATAVRAWVERGPGASPWMFSAVWRAREVGGWAKFALRRRDLLLQEPGRWFGPQAWGKSLSALRRPKNR